MKRKQERESEGVELTICSGQEFRHETTRKNKPGQGKGQGAKSGKGIGMVSGVQVSLYQARKVEGRSGNLGIVG